MKKNYFKIAFSLVFLSSFFNGVAQNDEKPVLERFSSSPTQNNKEEPGTIPELKKSSITVTKNNSASDPLEPLNAPQLKRSDYSGIKKEQPKNSK